MRKTKDGREGEADGSRDSDSVDEFEADEVGRRLSWVPPSVLFLPEDT